MSFGEGICVSQVSTAGGDFVVVSFVKTYGVAFTLVQKFSELEVTFVEKSLSVYLYCSCEEYDNTNPIIDDE